MRILPTMMMLLAPAIALASPTPSLSFSSGRAQQAMSQLSDKFAQADVDHNGKLTLTEAKAGMPRLADHFDEIDTQHKGYVTLDQIESFMQQRMGG